MPNRSGSTRVVSPGLVGRAVELELLASVVAHGPAVALVEGEAGVGKTRMIRELRGHAALADRVFLAGGCRRIREPFPLGAVLDSVRGLGDRLASLVLSPVTGALRPLLPELATYLPPGLEPLGDRSGERHRVFRGLVELLAALGSSVVVLEDLHWADDHTIDFVRYLPDDPPSMLAAVLTYRGEELPDEERTLGSRLPPARRSRTWTIGRISRCGR
jgi:predicted ATPase